MNVFVILVVAYNILSIAKCQRPPPGVNPGHYQQQQYQAPQQVPQQQYQQPQQQFQQVPQQQQYQQPQQQQQYQVPVQQYQQPQVPQQVPTQQQQQLHQPQVSHHHGAHGQQPILSAQNIAHEKEHIAEHSDIPIDTSKMSEQELQFHYFKMHDSDNNNKLDGCELIKSLVHWHVENQNDGSEEKVGQHYSDEQLTSLVDDLLKSYDKNADGYIDWVEFKMSQ